MTTGAISRAKPQSNHHHQQTNTRFIYRPDALPDAQPTASKDCESKRIHTSRTTALIHVLSQTYEVHNGLYLHV